MLATLRYAKTPRLASTSLHSHCITQRTSALAHAMYTLCNYTCDSTVFATWLVSSCLTSVCRCWIVCCIVCCRYGSAFCATEEGTGADNPSNPTVLTELERNRAIMYTFEAVRSFSLCLAPL